MWSDFGYDDDIAKDNTGDLSRSERPKQKRHNREHNIIPIKTSQLYLAGLIPWYTSGFE